MSDHVSKNAVSMEVVLANQAHLVGKIQQAMIELAIVAAEKGIDLERVRQAFSEGDVEFLHLFFPSAMNAMGMAITGANLMTRADVKLM